jgi:hypothetical protein
MVAMPDFWLSGANQVIISLGALTADFQAEKSHIVIQGHCLCKDEETDSACAQL